MNTSSVDPMLTDPWVVFGDNMYPITRTHTETFKNMLGWAAGLRSCMMEVYRVAVKYDQMSPIEDIPLQEKARIWEEAKKIAEGRELTKDQVIEISKIIYLIE